jgi:uncharacterized protein (DUF2141 family)
MTGARRYMTALLSSLALLGAPWPSATLAEPPAPQAPGAGEGSAREEARATGALLVEVSGFRNRKGKLLLAVFRSEAGFPNDMKRAAYHEAFPIEQSTVSVRVPDLAPGTYAVAVHHDEDGDFEMDTGLLGIPREGYGASRDAPARFGPPKFKRASFVLSKGQEEKLPIHIRYF